MVRSDCLLHKQQILLLFTGELEVPAVPFRAAAAMSDTDSFWAILKSLIRISSVVPWSPPPEIVFHFAIFQYDGLGDCSTIFVERC